MARIKYPVTFADEQTLLTNIFTEHEKLGAKSPLTIFAKQKKMDLVKMKATLEPADAQNKASGSLRRDSEEDTQVRNNLLALPEKNLHGEVDYLKNFYVGEERELGKWGVTVDGKDRIAYPTGAVAVAELIKTFLTYHLSLPEGESPLQLYIDEHEIDVAADLQAAQDAIDKNAERNATTGDSEMATQRRDLMWEPIVQQMHLIGAFLMGLYKENSRKMAAWGFVVVEDAAGERTQISTIDQGTEKNLTSIKIPSVLINVGEDVLQVIKGKGEKKKEFMLKPGEQLGMVRGFSKVTVVNPSTLVVGKVQVTVSK